MLKQIIWLSTVAVCAWLAASVGAETAPTFAISGQLTLTIFDPEGTASAEQTSSFRVLIRGEEWKIISQPEKGHTLTAGCNGRNVFYVSGNGKDGLGVIEADDYPAHAHYMINIPWFAFCSAKRIGTAESRPIPAPFGLASDALAHIYALSVTQSETPPYLPANAVFRTDAQRLKEAAANPYIPRAGKSQAALEEMKRASYERHYPSDFVAAEYHALTTTNVMGYAFPLSFKLSYFKTPAIRAALTELNNSAPRAVYQGDITAVTVAPHEEMLPQLKGRVQMVDYRFRSISPPIDYILYTVTNNTWPIQVSAQLEEAFKARKREAL
jgi:hypothetical protein